METDTVTTDSRTEDASGTQTSYATSGRDLRRPFGGRMLAGVAAGAADYFGVDVTLIRIAFAVLAVMGPGIPLYLAGLLLIPDEGTDQSIASSILQSIQSR